jgi:hypothetical protein
LILAPVRHPARLSALRGATLAREDKEQASSSDSPLSTINRQVKAGFEPSLGAHVRRYTIVTIRFLQEKSFVCIRLDMVIDPASGG